MKEILIDNADLFNKFRSNLGYPTLDEKYPLQDDNKIKIDSSGKVLTTNDQALTTIAKNSTVVCIADNDHKFDYYGKLSSGNYIKSLASGGVTHMVLEVDSAIQEAVMGMLSSDPDTIEKSKKQLEDYLKKDLIEGTEEEKKVVIAGTVSLIEECKKNNIKVVCSDNNVAIASENKYLTNHYGEHNYDKSEEDQIQSAKKLQLSLINAINNGEKLGQLDNNLYEALEVFGLNKTPLNIEESKGLRKIVNNFANDFRQEIYQERANQDISVSKVVNDITDKGGKVAILYGSNHFLRENPMQKMFSENSVVTTIGLTNNNPETSSYNLPITPDYTFNVESNQLSVPIKNVQLAVSQGKVILDDKKYESYEILAPKPPVLPKENNLYRE